MPPRKARCSHASTRGRRAAVADRHGVAERKHAVKAHLKELAYGN